MVMSAQGPKAISELIRQMSEGSRPGSSPPWPCPCPNYFTALRLLLPPMQCSMYSRLHFFWVGGGGWGGDGIASAGNIPM